MSHFSCRPQCTCTVEQKRAREGLGNRGKTRALIGGGRGEYSYLLVLPDNFPLKSVVIKVNFKRNSSDRTRIYEYTPPPPPIKVLVSPLLGNDILTPAKPS